MGEERRYYVYILASISGTLYVGVTNNLGRRVREHKEGLISSFSKTYGIDRLVYYEVFRYVGNAIAREKEMKGWVRRKKMALIDKMNPQWRDLSKDWGEKFTVVGS